MTDEYWDVLEVTVEALPGCIDYILKEDPSRHPFLFGRLYADHAWRIDGSRVEAMNNVMTALAARALPLPRECATCGQVTLIKNPHPKAGDPVTLEFGYEWECIPCLVAGRRNWYNRTMQAEAHIADLDMRIASLMQTLAQELEG